MGILKGRSGFMGRLRTSIQELQGIGETTTRAGLTTLERLTRTPVETRASSVHMVPSSRLQHTLGVHTKSEVSARFPFTGTTTGVAALFFSREHAVQLAELLLGSKKGSISRLGELEQSTIAETANIALNGCLNALSRQDGVRFDPGVPECVRGVKDLDAFLKPPGAEAHVAVVETVFLEPSRGIEGTMLLVLGVEE
jgi:chemotaxis protein CheY-P-specific phosphatase CheC